MLQEEQTKNNRLRFERQRRNLIFISCIMFAYVLLGVEINKLNIAGNELIFSDKEYVEIVLWVVLIYFFSRYMQYYSVVDRREFSSNYHSYLFDYVIKKANKKIAIALIEQAKAECPDGKNFIYKSTSSSVVGKYPSTWEIVVDCCVSFKRGAGVASIGNSNRGVTLNRFDLFFPKLKSICKVCTHTPHLSEYLFPPALAISVVVLKLSHVLIKS